MEVVADVIMVERCWDARLGDGSEKLSLAWGICQDGSLRCGWRWEKMQAKPGCRWMPRTPLTRGLELG
jgi:hypothetical protein